MDALNAAEASAFAHRPHRALPLAVTRPVPWIAPPGKSRGRVAEMLGRRRGAKYGLQAARRRR